MSAPADRTLLPTGATALERAVDLSAPRWRALADAAGAAGRSAAFTPWLAAEWGLSEFAPYFDGPDALVDSTLPWLFERGTIAAVRRALSWIGYHAVTLEEDGARLHIDLGRMVTPQELALVAHVVRASLPAHVHFYRIYHGLDGRPLRLDRGPRLDRALLDGETGVPVDVAPWGDPVRVSQAVVHRAEVAAPALQGVEAARHGTHRRRLRRHDHLRLDAWRLDSAVHRAPISAPNRSNATEADAPPRHLPESAPGVINVQLLTREPLQPADTAQAGTHTSSAPPALGTPRGWAGAWDASPWHTHYDSNTTEVP